MQLWESFDRLTMTRESSTLLPRKDLDLLKVWSILLITCVIPSDSRQAKQENCVTNAMSITERRIGLTTIITGEHLHLGALLERGLHLWA